MNRRVAVAGVALSDVGSTPSKTAYGLIAQASKRALQDTGLAPADIDGLCSTSTGTMAPIDVGEYLGVRPALGRLDLGRRRRVGSDGRARRRRDRLRARRRGLADLRVDRAVRPAQGTADGQPQLGLARAPAVGGALRPHADRKYAMAARRHMHEYGTTIEQLAEIAVSARVNARDNPEASYRDPITIDDVQSGPMIADPFTKLHCCIRSDGGAAVVLVAEDRVPDLRQPPVWVLGTGECTIAHLDQPVAGLDHRAGRRLRTAGLRAGRRDTRRTSTSPSSTTRSPTCSW